MSANDRFHFLPGAAPILSVALAFSLPCSVAAAPFHADVSPSESPDSAGYQEVISRIDGDEYCLTLDAKKVSVALTSCNGEDTQQWAFTERGSDLHISSKLSSDTAEPMCLGSNTQNALRMMKCEAAGSGSDLNSMRRWKVQEGQLRNAYVGARDASSNYLQSDGARKLIFGKYAPATSTWDITRRYGHITNVDKGPGTCMAVTDQKTVRFEPCADERRQDWRISPVSTNSSFLKITNRSLMGSPKEMWLDRNAKMVEFDGPGYQSTRSWKILTHFDPRGYRLRNKFSIDVGSGGYLGFAGDTIKLVDKPVDTSVVWNMKLGVPDIAVRPYVGDARILLIYGHYEGESSSEATFEKIRQTIFGGGGNRSFVAAVRAASMDRLRFTGDAVSDIDLGPKPSSCQNGVLRERAMEQAKKKGYDPAKYNHIAVAIPFTSACNWSGLANLPGRWMMSNGDTSSQKPHTWFHEFGHNLGAGHAGSIRHCATQDGIVQLGSDSCKSPNSAVDPTDTMGAAGLKLLPAPYLYFAGWLSSTQFREIVDNGTYDIAPLFGGADAKAARCLYLLRSDGTYLTLEFRQPLPEFEDWAADSPFVKGIVVRVMRFNGNQVRNLIVDTEPQSDGLGDAPLMPGHSVDDLLAGKRVTVMKVSATAATVKIEDLPQGVSGTYGFERQYTPIEEIED